MQGMENKASSQGNNAMERKARQGKATRCNAMQCKSNAAMQCSATTGWNALRTPKYRYARDLGSRAKLIRGPARPPGNSTIRY
eukprot:scaffold192514_cov22-Prasinocladus_malaysianus.AAC.1